MSGRLNIVAQLIRDREFDAAKQMLAKEGDSIKALYLLSLLHRYDDEYDAEKQDIDRLLKLDEQNTYAQERLKWHSLPLFERLVPRQPLRLPRDPYKIPSESTLQQLCFVTGGGSDSPYRECLIQLLESIRATILYKNTPIMVIDAGLTDADKHLIQDRFNPVTIVDPWWDVDPEIAGGLRSGLKGCTARPFIPKHFPGYRYYFWLDTDVWIQDERCLDLMIDQAVYQGVSAVLHFIGVETAYELTGSWLDRIIRAENWLLPEHIDLLQGKKSIAGGAFCLDKETGIFEEWQKAFTVNFARSKKAFGPDESSFLYSVYKVKTNLEYLGFEQAYSMNCSGTPTVNTDGILCSPESAKIMGLFHLCGCRKDVVFQSVIESNVPVNIHMNKLGQGPQKTVSLHYRTWPWADKPEIKQLLEREIACLDA